MELGTSMMSFGKVPCTPVTGAHVNFYDVFGDVERIGTGCRESNTPVHNCSMADLDNDEQDGSGIDNLEKRKRSFSYKCTTYHNHTNRSNDSYVAFLQEKQVEILSALHEEIRSLKSENAELKFQIHVILRDHEDPVSPDTFYRSKMVPSTPESYLGDLNQNRLLKDKEKTLELELESATKMIEELKWVKQHYEKRIRSQEDRIIDLETQLSITNRRSSNLNVPLSPIQMTSAIPTLSLGATELVASNRPLKSGRQRISSSTQLHREILSRRNSLQSLLPDDYKKAVATLPPILGNPHINGVTYNVITVNDETLPKHDLAKSRKSSLVHASHNPLLRNTTNNNNTPSLLTENYEL